MTKQIALERFTNELFEILEETFEHVHGIYLDRDTSLFETLETISAAEASRPVSATCASIAGQVDHVRFYLHILDDDGAIDKHVGAVEDRVRRYRIKISHRVRVTLRRWRGLSASMPLSFAKGGRLA